MEVLTFDSAAHWESWLAENHDSQAGVWLLLAKKGSGKQTVTLREALEVALCYGWIDSQRKSHDEAYYLQKYSPRRPRSAWSRVNVEIVEALVGDGRMRARGLAEVAAAKADGRWNNAYESQRTATVPPDLADALDANPRAKTTFDSLGKTDRYLVILRLLKARTAERRAALVQRTIAALEAGDAVS